MSLITKKREDADLSMTECAERAGMDLSKLSRLEHGQLKLKVDDLMRLARAIGCKPSELLPDLDPDDAHGPALATTPPEEA